MNVIQTKSTKQEFILLASSVLLTLYLFYIDEGYYNFNWMFKMSNWFAFIIYVFPIFGFQLLILKLIGNKFSFEIATIISIVIGAAIGLTAVISFLSK